MSKIFIYRCKLSNLQPDMSLHFNAINLVKKSNSKIARHSGASPASRYRGAKVSPKSEGFFRPKSQILTFFPAKNSNFFLPKKYRGGQEINRGGNAPCPAQATRLETLE